MIGDINTTGLRTEIVAQFVQMTAELQPLASLGNVIGRAFTRALDQNRQVGVVFAVPLREGVHQLDALACRMYREFDLSRICRGWLVRILSYNMKCISNEP